MIQLYILVQHLAPLLCVQCLSFTSWRGPSSQHAANPYSRGWCSPEDTRWCVKWQSSFRFPGGFHACNVFDFPIFLPVSGWWLSWGIFRLDRQGWDLLTQYQRRTLTLSFFPSSLWNVRTWCFVLGTWWLKREISLYRNYAIWTWL